ncbi:hypothetical protein B0J14DRAFT_572899 [Halenospora varia]|nr:hypothetical protein B0J14DRAFT_572899 [Halenospora varia]
MLCYPHIAFQYLDSPPMAAPTSQEQVEAAVEKPAAAVLENPEAAVGSSPVIDLTSEPTPIDRILELERQGFVGDLEATRQANELMKEVLKPWYSDEPQANEDAPFDPDTITLDPPEFYNAPLASANPVAATHESGTVTPENVQEPSSATSESVQTAVTTPVKQAATPEHVRTMDNMFPKDVQPTAARKASPSPAGQTPHVAVGPSTPDVPQHGRYPPSGGLPIPLNDQHSSPLAVAQSPLAPVAKPYGPQPHNPYHPGQLITPPDSQSSSAASANPSKKRKVGPSSSEGSPKRTKRQNPGLNVDGAKRRPGRPPNYVIDPVDSRRIDAETEALYKEGNGYAPKRKPGSKAKVAGRNVANNVSQQGSSSQAAQTMAPTSQQQANAGNLKLVGAAEQQRVGAPEGHMVPRLPPNNHSVPVGGYHHVGNVLTQHLINNPQGQMGPRQPPGGPSTPAGAQYRPRFHPYQPPLGPPQGQMGPAQSPNHPSMMNGYQPRAVTPSGQPTMNASQQQMRSAQSASVSFRPAGRHYQPGMHPGQQYLSAPQPRGYSPGPSTAASTPSGHMQPSPITTQHMGQSMPQQSRGYAQPPGNFNPNFQPAHQWTKVHYSLRISLPWARRILAPRIIILPLWCKEWEMEWIWACNRTCHSSMATLD